MCLTSRNKYDILLLYSGKDFEKFKSCACIILNFTIFLYSTSLNSDIFLYLCSPNEMLRLPISVHSVLDLQVVIVIPCRYIVYKSPVHRCGLYEMPYKGLGISLSLLLLDPIAYNAIVVDKVFLSPLMSLI